MDNFSEIENLKDEDVMMLYDSLIEYDGDFISLKWYILCGNGTTKTYNYGYGGCDSGYYQLPIAKCPNLWRIAKNDGCIGTSVCGTGTTNAACWN